MLKFKFQLPKTVKISQLFQMIYKGLGLRSEKFRIHQIIIIIILVIFSDVLLKILLIVIELLFLSSTTIFQNV